MGENKRHRMKIIEDNPFLLMVGKGVFFPNQMKVYQGYFHWLLRIVCLTH